MELSSCDETENVCTVFPNETSDLVECVLEFLQWWREQENGKTVLTFRSKEARTEEITLKKSVL